MSLQEILDSLLTSSRTGPLITATRHFEAKPPVLAPFPSSLDPRLLEALRSRGVQQLYSHQATAYDTVAKGENLDVRVCFPSTGTVGNPVKVRSFETM